MFTCGRPLPARHLSTERRIGRLRPGKFACPRVPTRSHQGGLTMTKTRLFLGWSTAAGRSAAVIAVVLGVAIWFGQLPADAAEPAVVIPAPAADVPAPAGDGLQTIVLAGGCFWGIQVVYQHLEGVHNAVLGLCRRLEAPNPTYEQVSSGRTGHAETVQVTFDPRKVSLGKILQAFFSVAHDPTQLNRQGPDVGTAVPLRDLLFRRGAAEGRPGLYRPARRRQRGSARPIVTRPRSARQVLSRRGVSPGLRRSPTPTVPTSCSTTGPRSRTWSGCSRTCIARSR